MRLHTSRSPREDLITMYGESGHIGELNHQSSRLVKGYTLAMLLLVIACAGAYYYLHTTQKKQAAIDNLLMLTGELRLAIHVSTDRTTDLRELAEDTSSNSRLLSKIRNKISEEQEQIALLTDEMNHCLHQLLPPDSNHPLNLLFREPPYFVQNKLSHHDRRINSLLNLKNDELHSLNENWMPVDAVGALSGHLLTGLEKMHARVVVESNKNGENLALSQSLAIGFILLILFCCTLFIFIPLLRGLQKAHEKMHSFAKRLTKQAYFDEETDLPNEAGLLQRINTVNHSTNVLVLQIQNPAVISQIAGLQSMAEFHRSIAQRLSDIFDGSGTCARTRDNEFVVVFDDSGLRSDLFDWGLIHNKLAIGISVDHKIISPDISLSLVDQANPEQSLEDHITDARLAALLGKNDGRISIFEPSMRTKSEKDNLMVEKIRDGLANDEFLPYYQLKFDAKTGLPCGMEALCRWQHPDASMSSPGMFIPIAETSNLIVDITWSLLDQICADISRLQSTGLMPGPIAFNAAAACLQQPDFVSRLLTMTESITQDKQPLEIEVTENVAIADDSAFYSQILGQLREHGFKIAMDDFGTGYASLSSVVGLEVDVIKIDQSFVRKMSFDPASLAVVETVINISHVLGASSVAEGVENQREAELLQNLGCNQLQGFLYHKPAPIEEVFSWLNSKTDLSNAA